MFVKVFLMCCAILLQGCGLSSGSATFVSQNMKQVEHSNGLIVGVPPGFVAQTIDNGFTIEPEGNKNSEVRRPTIVYAVLEKGISQAANLKTKSLNGKQVQYRIEKSEGGSGGEQYYLEVFEKIGDDYIVYSQSEQSEYAEPNFALCWQIAEHAGLKK